MIDTDQEDEEEGIDSESSYNEETRRNASTTSHMEIDKTIDDDSSTGLNLKGGVQVLTFHEYPAKINFLFTGLVTEYYLRNSRICLD